MLKIKFIVTAMVITVVTLAGASTPSAAPTLPQEIRIDLLSKDFGPVLFDHASHVDMVGDCSECHHHTTGTPAKDPDCRRCHDSGSNREHIACHTCHEAQPFSADQLKERTDDRKLYHRDPLGLKGAYHRNCVGCHETGGGPTDCLDCHPRSGAGERLFRTGEHAPVKSDKAGGHE